MSLDLLPTIEPPFPEPGDREAHKAQLQDARPATTQTHSCGAPSARPARSRRGARPTHQLSLRGAMGARQLRALLGLVLLWSGAGMAEALHATATPPAPAHGKEEAAAEGLRELRAARSSPRATARRSEAPWGGAGALAPTSSFAAGGAGQPRGTERAGRPQGMESGGLLAGEHAARFFAHNEEIA